MNKTINIDDLNIRQYEIFSDITSTPASTTKYFILRASRQSGKTFLIQRLAIYFAFEKSNIKGAFVSASWKQFIKVFEELSNLCPSLIEYINKGSSIINFINGTQLHFFTARNYNAITGQTFDFLICDEVALFPDKALGYITPVLAAKKESKAIFCSTPRGKGEFYDYCMNGMDESKPFYKHYRMMYTDNEYYDLREVEEKRNSMPEAIFRSEYLGEFVFGRSSVFGDFAQYQKIIKWPEYNNEKTYYFGIDWAGTGEDSTILTIIDEDGNTVLIYEAETPSLPEQVDQLSNIINSFKAKGYAECNGLGIGGAQMLQQKTQYTYKFWMSNESKNALVTNFLVNLKQNRIKLPSIDLCPKLDSEMCSFVVERTTNGKLTYHHEKGFHDDAVDSLLIAHWALNKLHSGLQIHEPDEDEEELSVWLESNPEQPHSLIEMTHKAAVWSDTLKYH